MFLKICKMFYIYRNMIMRKIEGNCPRGFWVTNFFIIGFWTKIKIYKNDAYACASSERRLKREGEWSLVDSSFVNKTFLKLSWTLKKLVMYFLGIFLLYWTFKCCRSYSNTEGKRFVKNVRRAAIFVFIFLPSSQSNPCFARKKTIWSLLKDFLTALTGFLSLFLGGTGVPTKEEAAK